MEKPSLADECNCFALRQAARYVTQIYERHLAPIGVTTAQYTILGKLKHAPDMSIATLANAMVMDRTTLVRALKPLLRDGLVVSESSKGDARAQVYRLSKEGEKLRLAAAVLWRAAQTEFEGSVGAQRAKLLRTELFDLTAAQRKAPPSA